MTGQVRDKVYSLCSKELKTAEISKGISVNNQIEIIRRIV